MLATAGDGGSSITLKMESTLMDEYRKTLISAVDAACRGDLQALLIAQWMLGSLRSGIATVSADHVTPPAQRFDGRAREARPYR